MRIIYIPRRIEVINVPTVETSAITDITFSTATSGGNVISDGGAEVMEYGIEWSMDSEFSYFNGYTSDGSGLGLFTSYLTLLEPDTTYYVRAYAINSAGTGYGRTEPFDTTSAEVPTVTTDAYGVVTSSTAELFATVVSGNGATVTERGFEWSKIIDFSIIEGSVAVGSGLGSFDETITGLDAETTYFWRPYAVNSAGTGYGETGTITTEAGDVPYYNYTITLFSCATCAEVGGGSFNNYEQLTIGYFYYLPRIGYKIRIDSYNMDGQASGDNISASSGSSTCSGITCG